MKYILYGNGGSGNHGCEAIVRGTKALLKEEPVIYSIAPEEDKKYGLEQIGNVRLSISKKKFNFSMLYAYLKMKITGNYRDMDAAIYIPMIKQAKRESDIALSIGGDNYCYKGTEIYRDLNRIYHQKGLKTVLWGCSVEPDIVQEPETSKDLRRYNMIVARESITYEAIKKIGGNVILSPDPAFYMEPQICEMDSRLLEEDVIGINISPMILKCAKNSDIAYKNYLELMKYIIDESNATIALIPHVVWENNDDRKVLRKLYEDLGKNKRIVLVEDHTAPELKYIISHCRLFIGARTHATIAAYSSLVPTLVVGYSVKARGIAKDLFGTEDKYVIPVQELQDSMTLVETFRWLDNNYKDIHKHLKEIMPQYMSKGYKAKEKILELF
ncbi:hypothetical protein JCM37172_04110 [Faecalimonas hominis]